MWTPRATYEEAYPGIRLLPRSRNWWAKLKGVPAECVHLDDEQSWIASLLPDTLYVRGKARTRREPVRPEVTLCRDCFLDVWRRELERYPGRVIAFEPDPEMLSQYFFVAPADFTAAGLLPEVQEEFTKRLGTAAVEPCRECGQAGKWEWFSRENVPNLGDVAAITAARSLWFCPEHGAQKVCDTFESIPEASLYYVNVPYAESGAYVWI